MSKKTLNRFENIKVTYTINVILFDYPAYTMNVLSYTFVIILLTHLIITN